MYVEKCFGKLKGLGIHPRQMPILAVLWKEDGCSQKELASQLGVKPPTVTVSIQRLEKIGIIVRKQDEKDQRISRIYLTEEGKAILKLEEGEKIVEEILIKVESPNDLHSWNGSEWYLDEEKVRISKLPSAEELQKNTIEIIVLELLTEAGVL